MLLVEIHSCTPHAEGNTSWFDATNNLQIVFALILKVRVRPQMRRSLEVAPVRAAKKETSLVEQIICGKIFVILSIGSTYHNLT